MNYNRGSVLMPEYLPSNLLRSQYGALYPIGVTIIPPSPAGSPKKTADDLAKRFLEAKEDPRITEARENIQALVKKSSTFSTINKIVVYKCEPLTDDRMWMRGAALLWCVLELSERITDTRKPNDGKVEIYLQNYHYTENEKEFLESKGFKVLKRHLEAFELLDDKSVFANVQPHGPPTQGRSF